MFAEQPVAVFSDIDEINLSCIKSMCDAVEVPFLSIQWDEYEETGTSINLYPYGDSISQVIKDTFVQQIR